MSANELRWNKAAADLLVGRKIVGARYMNIEEAEAAGWSQRPVVLFLDNGLQVYPMRDDEGNDGGALATSDDANSVLPVL